MYTLFGAEVSTHPQGEVKERWYKLCEQAATEQDPELEDKEKRLQQRKAEETSTA
jgi:hypothetical protein